MRLHSCFWSVLYFMRLLILAEIDSSFENWYQRSVQKVGFIQYSSLKLLKYHIRGIFFFTALSYKWRTGEYEIRVNVTKETDSEEKRVIEWEENERTSRGSTVELIRIDHPTADTLITVLYVIITQGCPALDSFNFSTSVHHLLGRLRALRSLIADRVRLPSAWLRWLLMRPFSWHHSGGTNLWVV